MPSLIFIFFGLVLVILFGMCFARAWLVLSSWFLAGWRLVGAGCLVLVCFVGCGVVLGSSVVLAQCFLFLCVVVFCALVCFYLLLSLVESLSAFELSKKIKNS